MRFEHWWYSLPLRLRSLFRRAQVERELDDELQFHVDQLTREGIASGQAPAEARREALRAMGGLERRKEECRDTRRTRWAEHLMHDAWQAGRVLRKSPWFVAVVVVSLALGIGANTAVFSLLDAVLLRPLPVPAADGLVIVQPMGRAPDGRVSGRGAPYQTFVELARDSSTLRGLAALAFVSNVSVAARDESQLLGRNAQLVSGSFFPLLGVTPARGRLLLPEDDRDGALPVIVLSHDYWTARFGADPAVIGTTVRLNDAPVTVVGVTPRGFFGVSAGSAPDVYLPLRLYPLAYRGAPMPGPSFGFLAMLGRLRPGVSLEQASARLGPAYVRARMATAGEVADEPTRTRYEGTSVAVQPGVHGFGFLRDQFGLPLKLLMAMVALVLVVSCGNVANLMLARAVTRRRELALRLSLGAARARVVRQMALESVGLALLGGAGGLVIARWATHFLLGIFGGSQANFDVTLPLDLRVLAFTIGTALLVGLLFTIVPASGIGRVDLMALLRDGGRGALGSLGRARVGRILVMAQVALSLVLLVATGLLGRTLADLRHVDLGYRDDGVALIRIDPRRNGYADAALNTLYRTLLERAGALPNVAGVALADLAPLGGLERSTTMAIEGYAPTADESLTIWLVRATPGYFSVLGQRLVQGTLPAAGSDASSALVNEAFAKRFGTGGGVVGRRVTGGGGSARVTGVVRTARLRALRDDGARPVAYLSFLDNPSPGDATLFLRTDAPLAAMLPAVRRMLKDVDPRLEILSSTWLAQQIDGTIVRERATAMIATCLGVLALVLASVGLYGTMSYLVSQRTSELGIRMALGASGARVRASMLWESFRVVGIGLAVGIPFSYVATRLIGTLLYGVRPGDPTTVAGGALVLLAMALLAGYLPARRAAKIDPIVALRQD